MELKLQHYGIIVGVILLIAFGVYCYHKYKDALKQIQKPSEAAHDDSKTTGKKHYLNEKHGPLKVWLSETCPWCKKQVAVFKEEGIEYEEQEGSPPDGQGVPQTQSAKTKKVCGGFKEAKDLAECLE